MREVLAHLNIEVPEDDPRSADEIADAVAGVLQDVAVGLMPARTGLDGLKIVCPLAEDIGGDGEGVMLDPTEMPTTVTTRADVTELVPANRRWVSAKPGIYPGPDDEVVRVELVVIYPAGLDHPAAYKVGRWWPSEDAVLTESGDGFDGGHGQYRLVPSEHPEMAMAHLAEFATAAIRGAILRGPRE